MELQIYKLDPAKFLSATGLIWGAALKKAKVILGLLTDIDVLLKAEKEIRGGLCHCINRYTIAEIKYMKDYDKIKEFLYFKYWNINSLHGWAILQKLSGNRYKWVKNVSEFNENFIKKWNEKSNEGYFLCSSYSVSQKLHEPHDLPFLPEIKKVDEFKKHCC